MQTTIFFAKNGKPHVKIGPGNKGDVEVKQEHLGEGLTPDQFGRDQVVTVNGKEKFGKIEKLKSVEPVIENNIIEIDDDGPKVKMKGNNEYKNIKKDHVDPASPIKHEALKPGMAVSYWLQERHVNERSIMPGSLVGEPLPADREPADVSTSGPPKQSIAKCLADLWECPVCSYFEGNGYYPGKSTLSRPDEEKCCRCKWARLKNSKDFGVWKPDNKKGHYTFRPVTWLCSDCGHPNPEFLGLKNCKGCDKLRAEDNKKLIWKFFDGRRRWEYLSIEVTLPTLTSGEHTSYEKLITYANQGYLAKPEAHEVCLNCGGLPHSKDKQPLRFEQFYRLDEESQVGELRRALLHYLLATFSRCECQLFAVPLPGFNHYYSHKVDTRLRQIYEDKRSKMQMQIDDSGHKAFAVMTKKDPRMLCHAVPLQAAGCPVTMIIGDEKRYNVVPLRFMCNLCQWLDALFTEWQGASNADTLKDLQKDLTSYSKNEFEKFLERHAGTPELLTTAKTAFNTYLNGGSNEVKDKEKSKETEKEGNPGKEEVREGVGEEAALQEAELQEAAREKEKGNKSRMEEVETSESQSGSRTGTQLALAKLQKEMGVKEKEPSKIVDDDELGGDDNLFANDDSSSDDEEQGNDGSNGNTK
jgi:hypothetical protein